MNHGFMPYNWINSMKQWHFNSQYKNIKVNSVMDWNLCTLNTQVEINSCDSFKYTITIKVFDP